MSVTTSTEPADAKAETKGGARELWELGKTVVYALLIAFVLRVVLFQPFTIPSASMEPNLYEGDYIIVSKFAYGWSKYSLSLPFDTPLPGGRILQRGPTRGDIVVFKLPRDDNTDYIKRLIGLPGDHIQVRDGELYINGGKVQRTAAGVGLTSCPMGYGEPVSVPHFVETFPGGARHSIAKCSGAQGAADDTAVYTVPAGCYFMMGDNRDNSVDSRFDPGLPSGKTNRCGWDPNYDRNVPPDAGVGFVPVENLVGKADVILLSWKPGASLFKPWTWVTLARPSRWLHWLQ